MKWFNTFHINNGIKPVKAIEGEAQGQNGFLGRGES